MESRELLEVLAELAAEAGLSVRVLQGRAGGDDPATASSGVCRVREEVWVVLAEADPVEERIEVLARALREHAAPLLEQRYLPPAVRARLGV